jgi:hypothetical protein
VDTDFSGHAGEDELGDFFSLEVLVEECGVEGAFAGLVDDEFVVEWGEFRDEGMAGFAAYEDAAHGAGIADACGVAASLEFTRREISKIGAMAFSGVDDGES